MKTIYHAADDRGHANHGWLDTYHSFSFGGYYDPMKVHFGALRVLNDDTVSGGMGFGKHPHNDMEIISIPLEGALKHEDSTGTSGIISKGDVQVMSAGTGILHSEKNASIRDTVKFLQIWIIPNKQSVPPRYDQVSTVDYKIPNDFQLIVSPEPENPGVWIHQEAWFHLADFEAETSKLYSFQKEGNGIYIFVIEGSIEVGEHTLNRRDGLGITDTNQVEITATSKSEFLLIEVPMEV